MIEGPGENICDECIPVCNDLIKDNKFKPEGTASCSFCSKTKRVINKDAINSSGCICEDCIELCNEILQEQQWKKEGFAFCSFFCRKTAEEVRYIVKGPTENICSECVNLFSTMLIEKPVREELIQNQKCAFCGTNGREAYLAGISNFICASCLDKSKKQIEANA